MQTCNVILVMAIFDSLNQIQTERRSTNRRRFLIGGVAAAIGYAGFRWWRFHARPLTNRPTKLITPNQEFYTVSIDEGFRPTIRQEDWRLEISGPNRFALSYDELLKLESQEVHKTFICVGNEPGGPAMGNAVWTATRLAPLLEKALGNTPRTNLRAIFHALDGFYSSVPLELAMNPLAWVAYRMNGEPLPLRHGFPARVLLPGLYGMKQPRWLSKIEIAPTPWFKGHWEARGFCDDCRIQMTARIDAALPQKDNSWLITGIALCGAHPVGKVELSTDEGQSWHEATLTSGPLSDAWTTWEWRWQPTSQGEHILTARVIDAVGNRQIESTGSPFPSGSTGLHRVVVTV